MHVMSSILDRPDRNVRTWRMEGMEVLMGGEEEECERDVGWGAVGVEFEYQGVSV